MVPDRDTGGIGNGSRSKKIKGFEVLGVEALDDDLFV